MNALVKASPAPTAMAVAVIERDPDENTARLLSAMHTRGCSVVVKHRLTFPTDPSTGESKGWREAVAGAEVTLSEGADIGACQKLLAESMAPALPPNIGMWLKEVSHITARRAEDSDEATLTMAAYIKRLVDYPGDIVRQTLQEWSGKWFPTWGELKEILDARTATRGAIGTALSVHLAATVKPQAPSLAGLTPEQRYDKLMLEARHARRTDPERARELEDQASEELALSKTEH